MNEQKLELKIVVDEFIPSKYNKEKMISTYLAIEEDVPFPVHLTSGSCYKVYLCNENFKLLESPFYLDKSSAISEANKLSSYLFLHVELHLEKGIAIKQKEKNNNEDQKK